MALRLRFCGLGSKLGAAKNAANYCFIDFGIGKWTLIMVWSGLVLAWYKSPGAV